MHRAIFMDRDGTVSEEIGYMYHTGLYKPFPWAGPAIRKINDSGMKAILITNQSGVERGYFTESVVHEVHDILHDELARHNAKLDAVSSRTRDRVRLSKAAARHADARAAGARN
jgi:D-glycero-D-manno-heptose 1,7-bisphosphate phosphatase